MHRKACITLTVVLVLVSGSVRAASDPAAVLAAHHAASGGEAWRGKAVLKVESKVSGQGMTGTSTSIADLRTGNSTEHYRLGPASGAQGFDGKDAWTQGPNGEVNLQKGGDALPRAINQAYQTANLWWHPGFGGATVKAASDQPCGSSNCAVLEITPKGGLTFQAWFDDSSHLLARTVLTVGGETHTIDFSDYRAVDGARVPYRMVIDDGHGQQYRLTATVTSAAFLPEQPGLAYAPPRSKVEDMSIAGGATETTLPFRLINNHIYADAWVNGHGPLQFIVDTGGENILVPSTAKSLGIATEGTMAATGVGDKAADYGLAKVASLRIGEATFVNQVVGVLDFNASGVEGVDIEGMVGFGVFKRFVTRIDYGAHTITLIDPRHFDPKEAGTPIPFVFNGNNPEVEGAFEGIPAKFDIDTGARDELTLTGPFAKRHGLRASHPKGVVAVAGWGVGGASRAYVTRGRELAIGPLKITDVVTALSLQKKGAFATPAYQGNIGGGILKRFVVTFDYGQHVMYLKPLPVPVADVGTYDRAGLWINAVADGLQVMDVTASGPAEEAGIAVGDVITAVDGKLANAIPVHELRRSLRGGKPGTVVRFAIRRGTRTRQVEVSLRDQI